MTEIKGWCVIRHADGWANYSASHNFTPYNTLFLKRPMYYCQCGKKCTPEAYEEYSKYLVARKKAMEKYIRSKR